MSTLLWPWKTWCAVCYTSIYGNSCNGTIPIPENQAFESTTNVQLAFGHEPPQADLISNPLYGRSFNQSAAAPLSPNPVYGLLAKEGRSSKMSLLDSSSSDEQRYTHQLSTQGKVQIKAWAGKLDVTWLVPTGDWIKSTKGYSCRRSFWLGLIIGACIATAIIVRPLFYAARVSCMTVQRRYRCWKPPER